MQNENIKDYGNKPITLEINALARYNDDFRRAIWTDDKMQITLMSLPPSVDTGIEIHDVDQFLYVVSGRAQVFFGNSENDIAPFSFVGAGDGIIVPSNTYHNIVSVGFNSLKLISTYAPQQHPFATVNEVKI